MMTRFTILTMIPVLLSTLAALGDDPKPQEKTISVSGHGKVSVPPNVADISVGVVTQAKTAGDALSANSEKMEALQKVLKERGVAAKDVQTTNISVSPRYSQPTHQAAGGGGPPRDFVPQIVGYDVTNTVSVTARDLAKLGGLLDAVVTAGANQMNGITFRIDDPGPLLDAARKKAMADAKKKAELMAGEAGVVVGFPITIDDESSPTAYDYPSTRSNMVMAAPAASVPVAAGEQELSVTVHVVYELKVPK